ncbi:formyltransferase family protein [Histidinibacterium aquaticum]|nr:formyltransferase family protein [Histidinibacterium aquaticum]
MSHRNLVVFGNKTTTEELIRYLDRHGARPDFLVTLSGEVARVAAISGRSEGLEQLCERLGIGFYACKSYSLKDAGDREFFESFEGGLGLCTGWQRLLPQAVLDRFAGGVFGWHGSCFRFPHGRGRSPLNWSIRLGGSEVWHNCFRYEAGVDTGPVFETRRLEIGPETSIDVLQYLALDHIKSSALALAAAWREGRLEEYLVPQPPGPSVELPKITPEDGGLAFATQRLEELHALVRSCARPFPGAFACIGGRPVLRIWRAERLASGQIAAHPGAEPGRIVDAGSGRLLIAAAEGWMLATDYEELIPPPGTGWAGDKLD